MTKIFSCPESLQNAVGINLQKFSPLKMKLSNSLRLYSKYVWFLTNDSQYTSSTVQGTLEQVKGRHCEQRAEPGRTLCKPRSFILCWFLPPRAPPLLQVRVMNVRAECTPSECWFFLTRIWWSFLVWISLKAWSSMECFPGVATPIRTKLLLFSTLFYKISKKSLRILIKEKKHYGELFQAWEMWPGPHSEKPVGSEVQRAGPTPTHSSPVGNQACIVFRP